MKQYISSAFILLASTLSVSAMDDSVIVNDQSNICGTDKACAYYVLQGFIVTSQKLGERVGVISRCDSSVSRSDVDCWEVKRPEQPIERFYLPKVN